MKNKLYVGLKRTLAPPKKGLFIHHKVPDIRLAETFEPQRDCFNPLRDMDYKKACMLVGVFEALFPAGQNTLTKEGVPDILLEELMQEPKKLSDMFPNKSKDPSYVSAQRMVSRIVRSPLLKRALCSRSNFSFKSDIVLAHIDPKAITDFDARALGLFLMAHFEGQIVVPDFNKYAADLHIRLLDEERLIAGVNTLDELPPKLRQRMLLVKDKVLSGTTYDDAVVLAKYAGLITGTNEFNDFVRSAIG
jgi:hypothetical protein